MRKLHAVINLKAMEINHRIIKHFKNISKRGT